MTLSWYTFLTLVHLIGLAWAVGAATVKLVLLVRTTVTPSLVPHYLRVAGVLTKQIILGLILLTASGIVWVVRGSPLSTLLVVKIILVGTIWVLGPLIDNVFEPRFRRLAPADGASASPEFVRARRQYLAVEALATGLFYVVIILWVAG